MSATSTRNPVAPIERKDIRSAGLEFKHDKDQRVKWSNGARPSAGVRLPINDEGFNAFSDAQKIRVRPVKPLSHTYSDKSHANRSRIAHKVDAMLESDDHTTSSLSKSLLDLLPQHANNTNSAIQIAIRESAAAADGDILYSFDNKGPSPGDKGRKVDLGGLVELAEKKFLSKQTDKLVKVEYEVLDNDGETTVLFKNKGKKSPKQKATKPASLPTRASATETSAIDDDEFEIIDALS